MRWWKNSSCDYTRDNFPSDFGQSVKKFMLCINKHYKYVFWYLLNYINPSNRNRTVATDLVNKKQNTLNPLWVLMPNCQLPFAVVLFENNYISSRTPAPCNSCFISSPAFLLFSLVGRRDDELLLKLPMAPLPWAGPNGAFVLFVSTRHLFFPVHCFPTPYHHIPPPQTPPGLRLSRRRSVERETGGRWMRSKSGIQLCPAFWCMLYLCLLNNSVCLISSFFLCTFLV